MKTQPKSLPTIKNILQEHVTLTVECLDRLYLNGYIPGLQTGPAVVRFLVDYLKFPVALPALLGQLSKRYIAQVEAYIQQHQIPVVLFEKRQRKDTIAQKMRRQRPLDDAVVFVGIAQEKAYGFKATKDFTSRPGQLRFHYSRQPVLVKHYYFYLDDPEFGEAFIKVCTYAPWAIKICLNGHEWAVAGALLETLDDLNGRILATGGRNMIRFWSVADKSLLLTYDRETDGATDIRFSPNSKFFAYRRSDDTVILARNPFYADDAPQPAIELAVILSWPSTSSNYILEAAPTLEGPWAPLNVSPALVGSRFEAAVRVRTENSFFRLRKS